MIAAHNISQPYTVRFPTSTIEMAAAPFYKPPAFLASSMPDPFGIQSLLNDIEKLELDWDGYGALPVSPESCSHVKGFFGAFESMPIPEVTPTPNGTIELLWESPHGFAYLEIGRTRYSGHIKTRNSETIYVQGNLSSEQELATEQVLLVIRQLLYGTSRESFSPRSVQITQSSF